VVVVGKARERRSQRLRPALGQTRDRLGQRHASPDARGQVVDGVRPHLPQLPETAPPPGSQRPQRQPSGQPGKRHSEPERTGQRQHRHADRHPGTATHRDHLLSTAEIAIGTALVVPVVPAWLAGAGLTAFALGTLGLYLRTPGMRQEGSLRPTQQGIPLAKDAWMVGIGLALMVDEAAERARRS
jgi:hypothetical protein